QKSKEGTGDLLSGVLGSGIKADEADTARSIRGLSSETEEYANNRGTPKDYRAALDGVLSLQVTSKELEIFLKEGRIGEYGP
ncbi:MAG: SH3 domain-containing protein, partial [Pseudomonadota bacterium]